MKQFPHLIVPINKSEPDVSFGNTLMPWITNTTMSVFNFDVPEALAHKECSVEFLWPDHGQMESSEFELSGTGSFEFAEMTSPVDASSTWNSCNAKGTFAEYWYKPEDVSPGSATTVWKGKCPAGQKVGWAMSAIGNVTLNYFQDFNPCPIGLYMNVH